MSIPNALKSGFVLRILLACLMGGLAAAPIRAQGIVTTPIGNGDDEGVALALQPDGKIVVAGFSHNGSNFDFAVVRYNSDSSLDTSFDGDGKVTTPIGAAEDRANAVAIQPDGKIVVAGFYWNGTSNAFAVVRYNSNGSLDTSFDGDGIATTNLGPGDDQGRAVAIQSDGKIVVGGYMHNGTNFDFAVVRYNSNGSLDPTFDTDGIVTTAVTAGNDKGEALALQSDGKILLAGDVSGGVTNNYGIVRYNTNGSLDTAFDTDGIVTTDFLGNDDNPRFIVVQADGRILVGGSSSNGASFDFSLARYNTNGSLDVSFDTDGKRTTDIAGGFDLGFGLGVQPDGKIVQAGWGHNGVNLDFAVVRYNSNGSLDTSFDTDGKVTTPVGSGNDFGYRMAVESDGKIVVAGSTHNGSNLDVGLVRYCPNGSTQGSFSGTFAYRKAITIDETRVMGSSDLIDFPVLISVTDPQLATTAFGGNVQKGDGSDIVFTASCGGPRLAHEIEKYVDSTGELIAWVKVPLVRYNVNTVIFMYYGNANVGCSTQNPSGVWDSSFKGVWHLKETPAGTQGEIRDSTANMNDGTGAGSGSLPSQSPGKIDGGLAFFGTNERHVLVPDNPSLRLPTAVTLSAWILTSDALVDNRVIAMKWDNDPTKRNYWLGKIGANLAFVVDDTQSVTALWTLVNNGTMHHVVGVADPVALLLRLYVDGVQVSTAPYTGTTRTSTGDFRIGNSTEVFQVFDGVIDEVQVSGAVRTAGWIDTGFRNQNSPGTFYSLGPQQACPCGLKINYRSVGTNGGTLYNVGNASINVGTTTVNFGGGASLPANVGVGDQLVIGAETFYILSRVSAAQVTVQSAATSTHTAQAYTITRAYTTLASWEAARQGNLAGEDRREIGVAYRDAAAFATGATIDGSTTDSCHFMWLTAAQGQRHTGVAGTGAILDGNNTDQGIRVSDDYTIVEWLELTRNRGAVSAAGVVVQNAGNVLLQNLLIYDFADAAANSVTGIRAQSNSGYTVRNSIIYNGGRAGIRNNDATAVGLVENCTAYNMRDTNTGTGFLLSAGSLTVTNSIAAFNDADFSAGITQSYNLSSDASAAGTGSLASRTPTDNPAPGAGNWVIFANRTSGSEDLHLQASVENDAVNAATDLSSKFWMDVDGQSRLTLVWDIGADELGAPTAVTLSSFSARGGDGHVWLEWTTASELGNLGFHLYRAVSESGSYERITARPIPGLGSSPVGARYSYLDSGLANGSTYYYKLEDIETTGRTEMHGPVSASPQTGVGGASEEGEVQPEAPRLVTFGDPSANRLRVVSWSEHGAVVELVTEGFTAEVLDDGTVRLEIPGFEPTSEPGFPSLPVTRPWLNAVGGRGVRLTSVQESAIERFSSLLPSGFESRELEATFSGTVRARRGRPRQRSGLSATAGLYPVDAARLLGTGFQGEVKKLQLEIAPLRWDGRRQELLLARRVVIRLTFAGRIGEESTAGVARRRRVRDQTPNVLIRLATRDDGLHGVRYEDLFPRSRLSVASSRLRLSRLGEAVRFHVEPDPSRFDPGSTLYFLSEGAGANPYGNEAVYELSSGEGVAMPLAAAVPRGEDIPYYWKRAEREVNRFYQAALLDAPDSWLWDVLLSPVTKTYPFEVEGLALSAESSLLSVWLQGASDFPAAPDHHLRVSVNGTPVAELSWDGKLPRKVEAQLPPAVLHEGENRLELENVGDTDAAYSLVFLDRFAVDYPRVTTAEAGRLEGRWSGSGTVSATGFSSRSYVLDVTEAGHPVWLTVPASPAGTVRFRAEAGRRYSVVAAESVGRPELRRPGKSGLKDVRIGAEYLVVGPREFMDDVEPLLELRRSQGLTTRTVSMEEVFDEFGFGEARPEALREFLEDAYHRWKEPKLRYVLLVGDATYDFKDYLGTGVVNRVPPLMVRTSYIWTASDPSLAAVNGEDRLPDFAIGRLPAASEEELRVLVEKILAYETGRSAASSSRVVLVADNPDEAGDFVADAEEIAHGLLAGRAVEKLYLSELGPSDMRTKILEAFDAGPTLVSYVGHGGIHLWAHENIFNTGDVPRLAPQAQQPLFVTMNCLNGYFHFPYFNSLSEELLKAEGKGVIAAFSPTGLSLNAPARRFHEAILEAILHQGHPRLGDAVMAAQAEYAASGAFPELLQIYHLLGDPALILH